MTTLSVNLNKFALLRNARGGNNPDVTAMGRRCCAAGADGLTVHPRPDQRHARYDDLAPLRALVDEFGGTEFNIEGNPIPRFLEEVARVRPHQCTLVPDADDQLTSDHGWDLERDGERVRPIIDALHGSGIRVSLFMDADNPAGIEKAAAIGADRIELYTEPYAAAFGTEGETGVVALFANASAHAHDLGLGVNAGHDLNLANLGPFLTNVPHILEVSIGHALVVACFDYTIEGTIERYIKTIQEARQGGL